MPGYHAGRREVNGLLADLDCRSMVTAGNARRQPAASSAVR